MSARPSSVSSLSRSPCLLFDCNFFFSLLSLFFLHSLTHTFIHSFILTHSLTHHYFCFLSPSLPPLYLLKSPHYLLILPPPFRLTLRLPFASLFPSLHFSFPSSSPQTLSLPQTSRKESYDAGDRPLSPISRLHL